MKTCKIVKIKPKKGRSKRRSLRVVKLEDDLYCYRDPSASCSDGPVVGAEDVEVENA